MKKVVFYFFAFFAIQPGYSQFGPQQIISSTTDKAYISEAWDIDNDGNVDVLTSSVEVYDLTWHRNLDGEGTFGPEILITGENRLYNFLEFEDIDSDGDRDLLYLQNNPSVISWMENLNGSGSFAAEEVILELQNEYFDHFNAADLDGDGDLDLVVVLQNTFTDRISWYENLDGLGTFGNEQVIKDNMVEFFPPVIVDIDGDGFLDLITSYEIFFDPAHLVWYKNLGDGTFGPENIIHYFPFFASDNTHITDIKYVDVNTDAKNDIVISTYHADLGHYYWWFENIDDQGSFEPMQPLPKNGIFCDIDNDGDNDIVTSNPNIERIYWIENSDGQGTFTTERTITTEIDFLKFFDTADFNNDGYLDVCSASLEDDKIAWYENTGVLGTANASTIRYTILPNPTSGLLWITSEVAPASIEIYDISGRLIHSEIYLSQLDISGQSTGIYFLRIIDPYGDAAVHRIIKK